MVGDHALHELDVGASIWRPRRNGDLVMSGVLSDDDLWRQAERGANHQAEASRYLMRSWHEGQWK